VLTLQQTVSHYELMARASIDDSRYWYERAEEARVAAEQMRDSVSKAAMLRIADSYDELAQNAARRARFGGKDS
jgi:hypothetical protein